MKSVTKDTTNPESTLSKKHNDINNLCQELIAAEIIRVSREM